jgi:hypothetical protein
MRLRIQSRHLLAYTKDLKKKNSHLVEENTKVSERIQRLENRVSGPSYFSNCIDDGFGRSYDKEGR